MRLQIKDSGSWRNMAFFTQVDELEVLKAAAGLLRALHQPKTVLRVTEDEKPLLYCHATDFRWVGADGEPAPAEHQAPEAFAPLEQGTLYPVQQSNFDAAIERLTSEMETFDLAPGALPMCGDCRQPVNLCLCHIKNERTK